MMRCVKILIRDSKVLVYDKTLPAYQWVDKATENVPDPLVKTSDGQFIRLSEQRTLEDTFRKSFYQVLNAEETLTKLYEKNCYHMSDWIEPLTLNRKLKDGLYNAPEDWEFDFLYELFIPDSHSWKTISEQDYNNAINSGKKARCCAIVIFSIKETRAFKIQVLVKVKNESKSGRGEVTPSCIRDIFVPFLYQEGLIDPIYECPTINVDEISDAEYEG